MKTGRNAEKIKFWRDPHLDHLELLHAKYVTHSFAPHAHEGFAIGVIEGGAQSVDFHGKRKIVFPAGSIAAINPGEAHTGHGADEEGWIYRMMYPSAGILQRAVSEIAGREHDIPFFRKPVIYDEYLAGLIHSMHLMLEDVNTSALERQSRLLWTLAQLIVRYAIDRPVPYKVKSEHASVRQACRYLQDHYDENISLDQLAAHVHLSRFHFLRVFKNEVGLPPHAYQNNIRVFRAKELLSSQQPIVDIALQTGFVDQSHLSKQFKRIMGVTPGQYRHAK